MKNFTRAAAALLFVFLFSTSCRKSIQQKQLRDFQQVNLVDNNGKYNATRTDPTLINAWGLAFSPNGIAWVNANGGHVSEVWDNLGNILRPAVNIPSPGDTIGGTPTGIVFNSTTADFWLSNGAKAAFIFVGDDGILSGWNGAAGANALLVKDNSSTAVYKGLTLASSGGANYLYAANFKTGKIDVWDKNFGPVSMPFWDPQIPAGYAPFNIQAVGSWLVVLYAKVGPTGDEETGQGKGFVNIFNTDGSFVRRFASKGPLNAPWGVAQAPASFFEDNDGDDDDHNSGDDKTGKKHISHGKNNQPIMLVGNFGDGYINAYSLNGEFLGQLRAHGKAISIEGLWALSFPPSTVTAVDPDRLYFTAGPDDEKDGVFGYLIKK
jgi:uncharacterized protein (TIGR03118 family)